VRAHAKPFAIRSKFGENKNSCNPQSLTWTIGETQGVMGGLIEVKTVKMLSSKDFVSQLCFYNNEDTIEAVFKDKQQALGFLNYVFETETV